jgi:hypothetical protein
VPHVPRFVIPVAPAAPATRATVASTTIVHALDYRSARLRKSSALLRP